MTRTNEAFWWSLFSAGGLLAAMVLPALVVVTGFALPYWISDSPEAYGQLEGMLSSWLVRLPLMAVIGLSFFHCGHRIRHTLKDLGLHAAPALLWVCCYGGAMTGTVATVIILASS